MKYDVGVTLLCKDESMWSDFLFRGKQVFKLFPGIRNLLGFTRETIYAN